MHKRSNEAGRLFRRHRGIFLNLSRFEKRGVIFIGFALVASDLHL